MKIVHATEHYCFIMFEGRDMDDINLYYANK